MKKQNIIIILVMVILLSIAILMNFLPTYHNIFFILKHGSFYLFITGLTVIILRTMYLFFIKRYKVEGKQLTILRVFTLVVLTATLFGTANMQTDYIDEFESPSVLRCTFYDDYNNVIYKSRFVYSSPEIDIIEKTETILRFKVYEETSGTKQALTINNVYYPVIDYTGKSDSEIEINYDEKHRIINLLFIHTSVFEFSNDLEHYFTHGSFKKQIENDYQDESFKSNQRLFLYKSDKMYVDGYDLFQHDFSGEEPYSIIEYESSVLNKTNDSKEFSVTIDANYNGEDTYEEIARGTVFESENESKVVYYPTSQSWYNVPYKKYEVIKKEDSYEFINYQASYPETSYHYFFKNFGSNKNVLSGSKSRYDSEDVQFIYKEPFSNHLMIETQWDLFRVVEHKLGKVAKVYQFNDGNYEDIKNKYHEPKMFYSPEMDQFYDIYNYGNDLLITSGYNQDAFLQVNPLLEYLWD